MPTTSPWWLQEAPAAPVAPLQRWLVVGRNRFSSYEIGYFYGRTPREARAEAMRRKGHLCAGLRLEAYGRL